MAHVKKHDPSKLESRTEKCMFVGYPRETNGYYFYQPQEQSVFVADNMQIYDIKSFISHIYLAQNDYICMLYWLKLINFAFDVI